MRLRALVLALVSLALAAPVAVLAPASAQERADRTETTVDDGSDLDEGDDLDDVGVEGDIRTEGGVKVKVFRFSGLDVAGRLKSPQLLYFLNRLRAEFDRPRLPHRSFIPELQRSTKGRAF
jgi:hypothetical protein